MEQVPAQRPAADPTALSQALAAAGLETINLSTADLTNAAVLDAQKLHVLVLPNAAFYPAAGLDTLDRYLRTRGTLMAFGPERFVSPLFQVGGRWLPPGSGATVLLQPGRIAWDLRTHGAEGPLRVSGDGTQDRPYLFDADAVKTSMYASMRPGQLPPDGAIICFQARGSKSTKALCLELQENDGSRWKQIVNISESWREYRVHTAGFLSYATPARTNDYFRGDKTRTFFIGLLGRFAAREPQHFEVRNLKFLKADVPARTVYESRTLLPGHAQVAAAFGKDVPALPSKQWPACLDEGEFFEGTIMPSRGHPLTSAMNTEAFSNPVEGRLLAGLSGPRPGASAQPVLLFPEAASGPRIIPLLEARSSRSGLAGLAGALVSFRTGPHAGGRWAIFALDHLEISGGSADLVGRVATFMAMPVRIDASAPVFSLEDSSAKVTFSQAIRNDGRTPLNFVINGSVTNKKESSIRKTEHINLPAFQSRTAVWHTASLSDFDWREFSAQMSVAEAGGFQDALTWNVNARDALRRICEFLADKGKVNGAKFSGTHYFIDHRGARTLLAGYEIFGDERYRNAAIAWAMAMVAEQRTDGGYRMGYGVGTRGESCFVADGGEIGLGVARAACYAAGAQRQQLLDSLKAYMGYRDSFRCEGGGIGVGWSFVDYGKRPPVPMKESIKVFAPEMNIYTIGCTLGAAYMWAAMAGGEKDWAAARADADWFMQRAKGLSGASAESFVIAHALERDLLQKKRYEEFLKEKFVRPLGESSKSWWLSNGARASLDGHAMSYWGTRVAPDPLLDFQMARQTSAMCAVESPTSVYKLFSKSKLNHDEWIYLCFGGLSLAEAVEPGSSFQRLPNLKNQL